MNIGRAIKLCRQQKGMKQAALAAAADISTSYLSLLERNQRDPNLSTVERISEALQVPISILMFLSADKEELDSLDSELAEKISWLTYKLIQDSGDG
tara:strand:- start:432 stop:722 length:291 start_codon:yes stop_codon:yes gene_type:complete